MSMRYGQGQELAFDAPIQLWGLTAGGVLQGMLRTNRHAGTALNAIVDSGGNGLVLHDVINLARAMLRTIAVAFAGIGIEFDRHVIALPGMDGHGFSLIEG
jgi:hypothetical protein